MSLKFRNSGLEDDDYEGAARLCEVDFTKTKSLTVQAPADEVDINKIMARVSKGQTVLTSSGQPFYGDVSEYNGLQEAIIKVQESEDLFMQYPAQLREKFDNDPINFVEFMSDPKNTEEAIKLGLAKRKPVPEPAPETAPAPVPVAAKNS